MKTSNLFFAVMFLLTTLLMVANIEVAIPFAISCSLLTFTVLLLYPLEEWRGYTLFVTGAVFIVYLVRVPVLTFYPESFGMTNLTIERLASASYEMVIPIGLLCLGFSIPILTGARLQRDDPSSHDRDASVLSRQGHIVLLIAFVVLVVRVFLAYRFGVGVKMIGERQGAVQFLVKLIPEMTSVAFCTTLVVVYRKVLKRPILLGAMAFLAANAFATILFGSKAGVLMVVFALGTLFLTRFRDRPIKKSVLVVWVVPAVLAIAFSFIAATTFRWATKKESNLDAGISKGMQQMEYTHSLKDGLLKTSARASAFDGLLIAKLKGPSVKLPAFRPTNVAINIVARLLPGVSPAGATISGATARYFFGRTEGFGASLGLFPTIELMFGQFYLFFVFGFGFVSTFLFSLIGRIKNIDLRLAMQFIFLFEILRLIMSGAFDQHVSEFFVHSVHAFCIMFVLKRMTYQSTFRHSRLVTTGL